MLSSVAGATFMNEFVLYAMQAPPLMRRTHQRLQLIIEIRIEFSWSEPHHIHSCIGLKTTCRICIRRELNKAQHSHSPLQSGECECYFHSSTSHCHAVHTWNVQPTE